MYGATREILHHGAWAARADTLNAVTLAGVGNRYLGDLAHDRDENHCQSTGFAASAGTLIAWFHRYQDVILRFAADLTVPSPPPPPPTPPPCSLEVYTASLPGDVVA